MSKAVRSAVPMAFVVALVLAAVSAQAQTEYTYPADAPVLAITFPEGWQVELDAEDLRGVAAISPDEEVELYIWPLPEDEVGDDVGKAIEAAAAEAGTDIAAWVTDATFGEPKVVELNGLSFLDIAGTGKLKEDGSAVNVSVTFFSPDGATIFAMLYYGSPAAEQANQKALAAIVKSIKRRG